MTAAESATLAIPVDADAARVREVVNTWLNDVPDAKERGAQASRLPGPARVRVLASLDEEQLGELLDTAQPYDGADLLTGLPRETAVAALNTAAPDSAAQILRRLPAGERAGLFEAMPQARAGTIGALLSWPAESVGARMTPHVVSVTAEIDIKQANSEVRALAATAETLAYVYVADADGALVGVLSFRDLVVQPGNVLIEDVMDTDLVWVGPEFDQEQAARSLTANHLAALPVLDAGRLVGVITADDVADIIEAESTEDAERQGGSAPLDVPYLRASPLLLWRKRVIWLLVLFVAEAYTGTVLRHFADDLEATVALAFFIPLLIGTGGNSGTQITSTLVRAMAIGEVHLRDVNKVLRKELGAGTLIALTMALAALIRAAMLGVGLQVGLTVTLTVAGIVLWSAIVGSLLPLALRRVGMDPAVVSAPLISTIVDGTGLIIYFEIARLVIF